MGWKPPLREGITPVDRMNDIVLCCDDRLRMARSLQEMTDEWRFFTVGCVYTYGGLDVNIVAEFTQQHEDPDCSVMTIHAGQPLFTGICPPGWPDKTRELDHELCAVPLEYWDGLRNWIGSASMVDRKRNRFAQATIQDLEIVDYIAVSNAIVARVKPPTVMIAAFGVDGTKHHVGFSPRIAGPKDTARVIKLPIRKETRAAGPVDPGRRLEPVRDNAATSCQPG